jgi:hypothetical protein
MLPSYASPPPHFFSTLEIILFFQTLREEAKGTMNNIHNRMHFALTDSDSVEAFSSGAL